MVLGLSPFKIWPDSPAFLLLLKIEISLIICCCFMMNQNELKFSADFILIKHILREKITLISSDQKLELK
jgi:hypothetical protein